MIINRPPSDPKDYSRKVDHIELAQKAAVEASLRETRFNYEPMLSAHPVFSKGVVSFLGKKLNAPIWISSMTGGADLAQKINENLARACGEFKLGMGLGSCRALLESDEYLSQFQLRKFMGDDLPLYANLGVAQIEQLIEKDQLDKVDRLMEKLAVDGLIVHINPLQEYFQPEGDLFSRPPIETITSFLEKRSYKVIIKEVGQGMGPKSLKALIQLPLAAIEFAGFGGTNFSQLEITRNVHCYKEDYPGRELVRVGHTAEEMVTMVNQIMQELGEKALCNNFIVSGGIRSFLDGQYLLKKLAYPGVIGQAAQFLKYAHGSYEDLQNYLADLIECINMSDAFLELAE